MLIILRNIPPETRYQDIMEFIDPALKPNWFSKQGSIEEVKILIIKDNDKETIEQHGLVRITPESCAKKVINLLNRKPLFGKRIAVREYQYRSWRNDPREKLNIRLAEKMKRRRGSRRRSNLESVFKNAVTFSSNKSFHRTYGS